MLTSAVFLLIYVPALLGYEDQQTADAPLNPKDPVVMATLITTGVLQLCALQPILAPSPASHIQTVPIPIHPTIPCLTPRLLLRPHPHQGTSIPAPSLSCLVPAPTHSRCC